MFKQVLVALSQTIGEHASVETGHLGWVSQHPGFEKLAKYTRQESSRGGQYVSTSMGLGTHPRDVSQ
jgi:hypothetical protein